MRVCVGVLLCELVHSASVLHMRIALPFPSHIFSTRILLLTQHLLTIYPVVCWVSFAGDFMGYMDAFKPYLVLGLKNHQEHQVWNI